MSSKTTHAIAAPLVFVAVLMITVLLWMRWTENRYRFPTESMAPTIAAGDTFTIEPVEQPSDLRRWDMLLFDIPDPGPDHMTVKRVLALPGERLAYGPSSVTVDGEEPRMPDCLDLDLNNLQMADQNSSTQGSIRLGEGEFFVIGDNVPRSIDSREYGPVDFSAVEGRVLRIEGKEVTCP